MRARDVYVPAIRCPFSPDRGGPASGPPTRNARRQLKGGAVRPRRRPRPVRMTGPMRIGARYQELPLGSEAIDDGVLRKHARGSPASAIG